MFTGARADITFTQEEVKAAKNEHKNECDFCSRHFKTRRDILIHRTQYIHNYGTTGEIYVVEDVLYVFYQIDSRWFFVK